MEREARIWGLATVGAGILVGALVIVAPAKSLKSEDSAAFERPTQFVVEMQEAAVLGETRLSFHAGEKGAPSAPEGFRFRAGREASFFDVMDGLTPSSTE